MKCYRIELFLEAAGDFPMQSQELMDEEQVGETLAILRANFPSIFDRFSIVNPKTRKVESTR